MHPEIMTLNEVCEYFGVDKRTLRKYGFHKIGGYALGPRTWRFRREEVMAHGVQKHQQQQGEMALDGSEIQERPKRTESIFIQERGSSLGSRKGKSAISTPEDKHGIFG